MRRSSGVGFGASPTSLSSFAPRWASGYPEAKPETTATSGRLHCSSPETIPSVRRIVWTLRSSQLHWPYSFSWSSWWTCWYPSWWSTSCDAAGAFALRPSRRIERFPADRTVKTDPHFLWIVQNLIWNRDVLSTYPMSRPKTSNYTFWTRNKCVASLPIHVRRLLRKRRPSRRNRRNCRPGDRGGWRRPTLPSTAAAGWWLRKAPRNDGRPPNRHRRSRLKFESVHI